MGVTRHVGGEAENEFELTPEGEHVCELRLKDCEVPKWKKGKDGKRYKSGELVPGIRFVFKVVGKDWYITTSVTSSTHQNGNLIKLMRELRDSLLKEIQFDPKTGLALDVDLFYDTLDSLEDYTYKVKCSHYKGDTRTFCNFESAEPVGKKEKEEGQVDLRAEGSSFEDDDIPF